MPGYPVLPAISVVYSIVIFAGLNIDAKLLMIGWFVIGLIIYFAYGIKHSNLNQQLKKVVK
jgi:APA family basic amino acid/polyamine antiporter